MPQFGKGTDPMAKIIFYSTVSPDRDDEAWGAFSLARRAVQAGLESEIFLAGPATGLLRRHGSVSTGGPGTTFRR
jgi:predicted peroxiredoxin